MPHTLMRIYFYGSGNKTSVLNYTVSQKILKIKTFCIGASHYYIKLWITCELLVFQKTTDGSKERIKVAHRLGNFI